MPELLVHTGRHYAIQFHYALPDDAWCVELSEAVPAPAAWAEIPNAETEVERCRIAFEQGEAEAVE